MCDTPRESHEGLPVLGAPIGSDISYTGLFWLHESYVPRCDSEPTANAFTTTANVAEIPRDLTFRHEDRWVYTDDITNIQPFPFIGFARTQNNEYYIRNTSEASHGDFLTSIAIKLRGFEYKDPDRLNKRLQVLLSNLLALTEIHLVGPECYDENPIPQGTGFGCSNQYYNLKKYTNVFKSLFGDTETFMPTPDVVRRIWVCRIAGDNGVKREVTLRFGYHGEVPCKEWERCFGECAYIKEVDK
ncbi:uncharacterized protein BDZ99DRAFT_498660 [Mytilinidion resinicola]|uniref:Uncharacterized protein n=1 Tax=Mytilinidion resinicola TaxID=574789 RepID=A0A6A6YRF4_9PEZI|nr:uncharacterized protein BDZ99DRAFT_498660 [Mytilinidion resinicola]KAF2810545.1 hypothetical protein BDZ99DRAFT_498660 [Mytilinidion resinicola]